MPEANPDAEIVAALVANHREYLAFLERRVGERSVAEDILQAAFVRGIEKLGGLRDQESVRAWFYRVLRNSVTDHRRRSAAASRHLDALAHSLDHHAEPEPELVQAICRCVAELARTLKPEYATILTRVEVDRISLKDFAREAAISQNNASVRIFRARAALRRRVAESCGTCATHGCRDCTCDASRRPESGAPSSADAGHCGNR
jgi:RNA polymerase sigma-70 factor (ECF subfamily)